MKMVGLDLSLTGTGVCVAFRPEPTDDVASWLSKQGFHVKRSDQDNVFLRLGLIKSDCNKFTNHFQRINYIIDRIEQFVFDNDDEQPVMWVIEDYFIGMNGRTAIELIELGAVVRSWLFNKNRSFLTVIPSQLKKFIIGKGVGDKGLVMMNLFKKWGVETTENNSADATVAANIGLAYFDFHKNKSDYLTIPQQEVIKKISS